MTAWTEGPTFSYCRKRKEVSAEFSTTVSSRFVCIAGLFSELQRDVEAAGSMTLSGLASMPVYVRCGPDRNSARTLLLTILPEMQERNG
jgi:hypothetical protein